MQITFSLNGDPTELEVRGDEMLLTLLRERLGLTGTKPGCLEGECGACTVLVDGAPANACLLPVAQVDGATVRTIEGLARGGELHPVQRAFVEEGAVQCGYCTPGMVLTATSLLERVADPDEPTIRGELSGNLCRCTGYGRIVAAIQRAAREMKEESR